MRIATLLALLLASQVCATPTFAQTKAHSSPEDRQRFVSIEQRMERTPFDPSLSDDREWALRWLIEAPDVTVNACLGPLGGLPKKDYSYNSEILYQYSFAMAAFIIQNPTKSDDQVAQQLAGVESALNAYRAMRIARPQDKSPSLDKLLATQGRGELPDFVQKAYRQCVSKGRKELHQP